MRIVTIFFLLLLIQIVAGTYTPLQAQVIQISPQPIYFGLTPNDRESDMEMVLRNLSGETLNVTQISIQGTNAAEFSVVDNPGSLMLAPYARTSLTINFHPTSVGEKQAQISFVSNSASSPDNVDLLGGASSVSGGRITFEKILGTLESDGAGDVRPTADGGFIIAGNTLNPDEIKSDGYLMKTNAYGEVEWTNVYDGDDDDDNNDGFRSVVPVSDGYIAIGNSDINDNRRNSIWVVKTNLQGVFQWEKFFGGTENDEASVIEETNDGNFIIAGTTRDPDTGNDGYLLKIDGEGTELWSELIGGTDGEKFSSIKPTDDGGYIICGSFSSATGTDMYLVKTNSLGQVIWSEQYGDPETENAEEANSVIVAPDGGYILAGWTTDIDLSVGAKDVYIIKTNSSGVKDLTWGDKTFGEAHLDAASEIIETSDGGFLISASIENIYDEPTNDWYSDAYIIKLDQNGDFEWDNIYGGERGEGVSTVREVDDGSFVLVGGTNTYGSNGDIYFLRVNNNGNIPTALKDNLLNLPNKIYLAQNYPNPFNNRTTISYNLSQNSAVSLKIFDISGRLIETIVDQYQNSGTYRFSYNAASLSTGVYFYQLSTDSYTETKKLLLIK